MLVKKNDNFEYLQYIQGIQSDMRQLDLRQSINLIQTCQLLYQSRFILYLKIICPLDEAKSTNLGLCLKDLSLLKGLDIIFLYPTPTSDKIISPFFQNLHYLENLEYLSLQIISYNMASFYQNLADNLKSVQHLKYFNLYVYACSFTIEEARQIKQGIKSLKQLKSLSYCLGFSQSINDNKILAQLCKGFKNLNSLEHLSLNIKQLGKITSEFLQGISQSLTKLQNLNSLHLKFMQTQIFSQEGLIQLSDSLLKLTWLSKLLIVMDDFNSDGSSLISLLESVLSMDNLTELKINISIIGMLQNHITLGQSIKKSSQLQKLHINLRKGLKKRLFTPTVSLDKNFCYLKKLTKFCLNMNLMLVDTIEQGLFKLLQNCLSIQILKVQCKVVIDQNQNTENYLEKLSSLKQLNLQIYQGSDLNINYLESLKSCSRLQKLENLQLFVDDNLIQSSSIQMKEYLQQLICLKSLSIQDLSLRENSWFFNSIGDSFYQMKNLQKLDIEIQQMKQNEYFESLSESFQFLENLRYLSICYYDEVDQLLFNSWKQLAKGIKKLKNLSSIQITFQCKFYQLENLIEFFEALINLQYLNIVKLQFYGVKASEKKQWLDNIIKKKNNRLIKIYS